MKGLAIVSEVLRAVRLSAVAALACGFVALPVERFANSSRTDAQAADERGGWLDLGSNDLSVLPAGKLKCAGVDFVVPPSGDETAKNCLVLGRKGAETVTFRLETPVREECLFLLHAVDGGPAPETGKEIGKLVLRFDDGLSVERPVCVGTDVSAWTSGRSFANAVRAWTEYNHNTQVSLFVSQFDLKPSWRLTEVSFEANGSCPWMVLAVTAADKVRKLRPIRSSVEPTGTYKSPDAPRDLGRFPVGQKPKNVILIVGDGMGQGAAQIASYYKHGRADGLYFQQFPVVGFCSTFSASAPVTDSAASATAFATGTKTSNGVLGLQVDAQHSRTNAAPLVSVAARAHAQGRGVAILTTDPLTGATPAAFFAHVTSRGEGEKIALQAADCGYDVLVGSSKADVWFRPAAQGGKRTDGRDLVAEMTGRGYAYVQTAEALAAAPAQVKVFGSLTSFGDEAKIDEMAVGETVTAALGRVGKRPEGFFMMAECGATDHACHANNSSFAVKTVSMVEFMAKAAIDFAQARGDTLVVVTADHDTGHASVIRGAGPDGRLVIQWQDTSHTKFPVPVYAYGPGAELFEGLFDNTDIAKSIARLLNLGE